MPASCVSQGVWYLASCSAHFQFGVENDNTVRNAVGLCLWSTLCHPHDCQHCRAEVDHQATHGLSCKNSEERHYCHGAINDIVHRAFTTAQVPSRLEPSGLARTDEKRPDVIPWKNGKPLVWDATHPRPPIVLALVDLTEGRKSIPA